MQLKSNLPIAIFGEIWYNIINLEVNKKQILETKSFLSGLYKSRIVSVVTEK